MKKSKWNHLFSIVLALQLFSPSSKGETVGQAIDKINQINQMRESLAEGLKSTKGPINEQTFKEVCVPVGQALMAWAKTEGHQVRQLTDKFRNPQNKADGLDLAAIKEFRINPARQVITEERATDGVAGIQIYRRIDVQANCLHCHGPADRRPVFIKTKYPKDLAHGFKPGDLRGIYSVWIKSN